MLVVLTKWHGVMPLWCVVVYIVLRVFIFIVMSMLFAFAACMLLLLSVLRRVGHANVFVTCVVVMDTGRRDTGGCYCCYQCC